MTQIPVSVVIVSRDRPGSLRKTLRALGYQAGGSFEVIVVCDPATAQVLEKDQTRTRFKLTTLDEANISKARNIGIAQAAGDVVAFIDDDAIPEPTWLARLTAPFENEAVAAAGGFVRGRNGISLQWQAEEIGLDGSSTPIDVKGVTVLEATPYRAIKTQGTNCAFRRDVLLALGGFDESFRFYLDETDLNDRLGQAGHLTAIVPEAEVQHGYAASAFRGRDRRPRSVYEIAASQAHYCEKHGVPKQRLAQFRSAQVRRIERAFVAGQLEPRDVRRLRKELDAGFAEGQSRAPAHPVSWPERTEFLPFATTNCATEHRFISARWLLRRRAFEKARRYLAEDQPCTVILLSLTALYHRRYFHEDGFWVQSGGIFGKSTRSDPLIACYLRSGRFKRERNLLARTR